MIGANTRRLHLVIFFIVCTLLLFGYVSWRAKLTTFMRIFPVHAKDKNQAAAKNEYVWSSFQTPFEVEGVRVDVFGTRFVRTHGFVGATNSSLSDTTVTEEKFIDTKGMGARKGFDFLNALSANGQLDFRRPARYPVSEDWLTPMDMEMLAERPVTNLSTIARPEHSTITVTPWPPEETMIKTGGKVRVRLDLKDEQGRPVRKGGHLVRIWMVQQSTQFKRAIAADVTDLRNGSYVATLPVLWRGTMEVRAALIRSREVHRLILSMIRTMKLNTQVVGVYTSGNIEQATLCSFLPVVPGYPDVCNLTRYNFGLSWYCGKPSMPGLRCDHWTKSRYTAYSTNHRPADRRLLYDKKFRTGFNRVKDTKFITVTEGNDPPSIKNETCVPMTPLDSWTDQSPRGYFENSVWKPLTGCPLLPFDKSTGAKYFRDTHILFLGDSNMRLPMQYMQEVLGCQRLKGYQPEVATHAQLTVFCKESNATFTWVQHAYPYLCDTGPCEVNYEKYAPAAVMDRIPSTGKYVVLFHIFLHFAPMHNSIYAQHVRHAVQGIRDLLARKPSVKVFVRSPHALCKNYFLELSDYHAKRCMAILQHEFRDLRDRVMLLNDWDMSLAVENCAMHPVDYVSHTLVRMIVSHLANSYGRRDVEEARLR